MLAVSIPFPTLKLSLITSIQKMVDDILQGKKCKQSNKNDLINLNLLRSLFCLVVIKVKAIEPMSVFCLFSHIFICFFLFLFVCVPKQSYPKVTSLKGHSHEIDF
jgi:hypothetical protein